MIDDLKKEVCEANLKLPEYNLVIFTEGNVSAISPDRTHIIIKPSGISYSEMKPEHMVVVDMKGNIVEGTMKPSSDTLTHIEVYKHFPDIKAIVHTHSPYATSFAQMMKEIPCLGTTHADNFYGDIPVTRNMKREEIETDYELNTGKVLCETIKKNISAVLVASHGPFVFGTTLKEAINNAVVLEKVAMMAFLVGEESKHIDKTLLDKHYLRKHGKNKYYGQN